MLGLVDDLPKVALVALATLVALLRLWSVLDLWTVTAMRLRRAWALGGRRRVVVLLALGVFACVAEDVLEGEHDESVLWLDRQVRHALARSAPDLHHPASLVSHLTGDGLAVTVPIVGAALVIARRRREAVTLLLGTLGAWLVSGILKTMLAVPRPRAGPPWKWYASFGFPSGHTLVTIVACGLIVWALARRASRRRRLVLIVAGVLVAAAAGAARIALSAHWTSDVIAGLAAGVVWLYLVVSLAERWLTLPAARAT